uniref:Gastric triacylglycerol lipase n=1 Tax=Cacopsylla melanoneura TaxID=428564 RepID=A0A8D8LW08_9HEMI
MMFGWETPGGTLTAGNMSSFQRRNIDSGTLGDKYVKYSTEEYRFWNFSFHEMGLFDAPACIDHILLFTKQDKVSYIGHSMATTIFYIMFICNVSHFIWQLLPSST